MSVDFKKVTHSGRHSMLGQVVVGTERVPAKDIGSESESRRPFLFTPAVPRLCFFMGVEAKPYVPRARRLPEQIEETAVNSKNADKFERQKVLQHVFIQHHSVQYVMLNPFNECITIFDTSSICGSKNQVVLGTLVWGFVIMNYSGIWHSILFPHSRSVIRMLVLKVTFYCNETLIFTNPQSSMV